jgi:hypothetical protein
MIASVSSALADDQVAQARSRCHEGFIEWLGKIIQERRPQRDSNPMG